MSFFEGFADELMKVAGGAKAQYDASGKFIGFKSAYVPPKVKPMPPKVKQVVKPKIHRSSGLVGGKSGSIGELKREGVFIEGREKAPLAQPKAREIKLPRGNEGSMAREMKLPR